MPFVSNTFINLFTYLFYCIVVDFDQPVEDKDCSSSESDQSQVHNHVDANYNDFSLHLYI